MNVVELFSGSGTISQIFAERGHRVLSIDIRRRKGICEPTLRADVLDISEKTIRAFFDGENPHVLWASPPCQTWSYAPRGHHWSGSLPLTARACDAQKLVLRTLQLIDELTPAHFFIENPRGLLRKFPPLLSWLEARGGSVKTLTLSSYGFPMTKPTNIFTNALAWQPRPLAPFGRGARSAFGIGDLSRTARQATPRALAEELADYCEKAPGAFGGASP